METVRQYALSFVGLPYKWGGSNPMDGFDCSGLVQEILMSCGVHPNPKEDFNAQTLFNHFEKNGSYGIQVLGSLAFYGKSVREITHVAFCIDSHRIIEAGGGGHLTLTKTDAAAQNAFVRIRLAKHRSDLVAVIKPNYAPIGVV
jgi:cell wall-associated NlpC family hydrolase